MFTALAGAIVVALIAGGVSLGVRSVGDLLAPPQTTASERTPFLGGLDPETHAWSRFHVRYYAMSLLFLAFDMEMIFMYPWAVVFLREGVKAMVEMLMFIVILTLGILYAWRERAFEWS